MQSSNRQPSFIYTIVSMTLVLFLSGCLVMGWLYIRDVMQHLREQVTMLVELKDESPSDKVNDLKRKLGRAKGVKKGSIQLISKETALAEMKTDLGEEFLDSTLQNPLQDAMTMFLEPDFTDEEEIALLKNEIRKDSIVSDVYTQSPAFENVEENAGTIAFISSILIGLFLIVSFVLIHNTNRLALYTNRFIIKNMELVGASWSFISKPYIRRGAFHGFISGLLASVGLVAVWMWLVNSMPSDATTFTAWERPLSVAFLMIVIGVVLTSLSTWVVVNRFLKMRLDDLY